MTDPQTHRSAGEPRADARQIARLSSAELHGLLDAPASRHVFALNDWLARDARQLGSAALFIETFCARLIAAELPLDRYVAAVSTLHAGHDAVGRLWTRGGKTEESVYVHAVSGSHPFFYSPLKEARDTREWVEMRLAETPDDRFGIVPELKADGYTHYICAPIFFLNGTAGCVTMASKSAAGFSAVHLATIALILPALAAFIEARVAWNTLDNVLRTYVGNEPHQAILAGNVKRGMVSTIHSAMLFADMRDSTKLTAGMTGAEAADLLNTFFDCLVPAIEQNGGEVLKYLGDGLLAIFRVTQDADCDAPGRALAAARQALALLARRNNDASANIWLNAGIALHYGEVGYGNIGSGLRLDFTVIGRDVNLASRIADMNRPLGQPLLLSAAFAAAIKDRTLSLGRYEAKGFADPLEVHCLAEV